MSLENKVSKNNVLMLDIKKHIIDNTIKGKYVGDPKYLQIYSDLREKMGYNEK